MFEDAACDSDGAVTSIDLHGNNLAGTIPAATGALSSLASLNLSGNQLTSSIPEELGNLAALTDLDLHDNSLTGDVPASIGTSSLKELSSLDLSGNSDLRLPAGTDRDFFCNGMIYDCEVPSGPGEAAADSDSS